jgi:hypothetical protein
MRVELRIPASLAAQIREDLVRANPLGGERVGFMATRSVMAVDTLMVTAHDYRPVGAADYMTADDVGVRIGSPAIRCAMEWGMADKQGIWHLHAMVDGDGHLC